MRRPRAGGATGGLGKILELRRRAHAGDLEVAASCLLAALGRWEARDEDEQHVMEMVGASLLMDGLRELELLRKAWTT